MKLEMNKEASDVVRTVVVAAAWVIIIAGWPRLTRGKVRS